MGLPMEAVALGVAVFTAGFLCTQFLSLVLTLDALVTFIVTTVIAYFSTDWLAVLYPDSPIDALHEYLLINVLAALLVPALVWFLSTDPTDVTIRTSLALSRLASFGFSALVTWLNQRLNEQFEPTAYQYVLLPLATLTMVYAIHMYYNSRVNASTRYGNLNGHLQADLTMSAIGGLLCVFAPSSLGQLFGQELNGLHIYLYRMLGVITLGYICLPWIAVRFRAVTNKRAVLFSRALTMLVTLLVTFQRYRTGDIPEGPGSKTMIACLIIITLPSAIGAMRFDQGEGWDMPWRGLRVPEVQVGGSSPVDAIYSQAKKDMRKRKTSRRRSRSRRRRTPSRGRRR